MPSSGEWSYILNCSVGFNVCFNVVLFGLKRTNANCSHASVLGRVNRKMDIANVGFVREVRLKKIGRELKA